MTVAPAIAVIAAALLLGWTGAAKLAVPSAPPAGLVAMLGDRRRAARGVRLLAVVELAVAVGLVAWPVLLPALAATLLGIGFLGYLAYARRTAPGSPCGCAGDGAPVSRRSYVRAGWVVLAGGLAAMGTVPWWQALAAHPVLVPCGVAAGLMAAAAWSAEFDRWWLMPVRRTWLRLRGHPLAVRAEVAPVAASVELVEGSRAWHAAARLVRSSLVEHWIADGSRVLRYTGVHPDGARPVSVLFAVDAQAHAGHAAAPVVRLAVVDLATQEVLDPSPTELAAHV